MIIEYQDQAFVLQTAHTTYAFCVKQTGHLEHLYYGKKITVDGAEDLKVLEEKHVFAPGNTIQYAPGRAEFTLEDVRLEMSSFGKGDIREPFVEMIHADGSRTSDFVYESAKVMSGRGILSGLPSSYGADDEVEQLYITLKDRQRNLRIDLFYIVYEDSDVICRSAKLINESEEKVQLKRLMSTQLDLDTSDYVIHTFHGAWTREMCRHSVSLDAGKYVNASYTGTSSSRTNPFVMFGKHTTSEEAGECFAMNLIYSGNHYEAFETNSFGKLRVVAGINPMSFLYQLEPGEEFQTPEAVMVFAEHGYQELSRRMHHFVREHIVRGGWKYRSRPVLLNSWEACYFKISERKLLNLASAAKEAGMELFVVDDGWFGKREDDTSSLGDWEVDRKKLPGGLKRLGEKVTAMGLAFGIWVEPEMVNVKSRLFESHPEWTIDIPGQAHSEGRNQRLLDLTRTDVQDYIIERMTEVFSSAPISYVKWDMNRIFSDVFSRHLPAERQGEVFHRYVLGLYRCMKTLTERFPEILFEGCAAGGNRFDLGILCYFPQIWASDDTDALCRAEIQNGYSYGYPLSTISAHVSACPNHQTLRTTPMPARFHVASFGVLGYECNLCELSADEKKKIAAQVALYKEWRDVFQWGDFYRGRSFHQIQGSMAYRNGSAGSVLSNDNGNITEWTCVSQDRTRAVGMLLQKLVLPNTQFLCYQPKGLDAEKRYKCYNLPEKHDIREFGSLVNAVSPVHIREHSLTQNLLAKFVKLDGEVESYTARGDMLMYGGVHLAQAFSASGYGEGIRHFPDFASRMYFMEEDVAEKSICKE